MSDFFVTIPPLYDHQQQTVDLLTREPRVFDMSDPGTGKTRSALQAFVNRRKTHGGRALVVAPKSILQVAWGADVDKFFPGTSYMCAYATNRKTAFERDVDVIITNHDAVKWAVKSLPKSFWSQFDTLIVDESTAFKNPQSQRSKAINKLSREFEYREVMTGTPNPNSVTELWHQVFLLDEGARLGDKFYRFRSAVCEPVQVGPSTQHIEWRDKTGAEEAVYDLIEDITIRHRFEDCTDIPPNKLTEIVFDLPRKVRQQYKDMLDMAAMQLEDGSLLTAVHAASVHTKLLQIAAGAVYTDTEGAYETIDDTRTELIMDLLEERDHSVVGFIWKHQRKTLVEAARKRGFSFAVIDGETNDTKRRQAVDDFQAGKLKVLFAHPQSAGHGLTLTRGTTTIWASPTYNSEHYKQLYHRIYRAGQTERTETIHIIARDTIDEQVYEKLGSKLSSMQLLLELMEAA